MGSSRKPSEIVEFTFHALLFQYTDKPTEWHACCVENSAFGWGNSPEQAVRELQLTISGQLWETFQSGKNFFFQDPEERWVKAYREGVPPSKDVRIVARLIAHLSVRLTRKPDLNPVTRVEVIPVGSEALGA